MSKRIELGSGSHEVFRHMRDVAEDGVGPVRAVLELRSREVGGTNNLRIEPIHGKALKPHVENLPAGRSTAALVVLAGWRVFIDVGNGSVDYQVRDVQEARLRT